MSRQTTTEAEKLLLAENILINCRYDDNKNNYENSEIRGYLNGDFYNTAFTSDLQNSIATTTVVNDAESTNPDGSPNQFNNGENLYVCDNTEDKVFLLSEQEVTTEDYGFAECNTEDNARVRKPTDFALAEGASTYQFSDVNCGGYWCLRSPSDSLNFYVRYVKGDGSTYEPGDVDYGNCGVVPALCLSN